MSYSKYAEEYILEDNGKSDHDVYEFILILPHNEALSCFEFSMGIFGFNWKPIEFSFNLEVSYKLQIFQEIKKYLDLNIVEVF